VICTNHRVGTFDAHESSHDIAREALTGIIVQETGFRGIDFLRKHGSGRGEHVELDENVAMDSAEANIGALGSKLGTNPQKSLLRKELAAKIEEALQQVPEKHRAILLLREIEGMSYDDLARTLDIPKGTVMSRLFHARAKIQKVLSNYLELDESKSGIGSE